MSMQDQNVLNELFESSPFCWTFLDIVQLCQNLSNENIQKKSKIIQLGPKTSSIVQ